MPKIAFVSVSIFLLSLAFGLLNSCSHKREVQNSFYYWRADFKIDSTDANYFKSNNISKLYLRLFDIKWNKELKKPYPEGIVEFNSAIPAMNIVPVIYITNEVFLNKINSDSLCFDSFKMIDEMCKHHKIDFSELQFDCDWTKKTKSNYFNYLKKMKKYFSADVISATIRLHQVKYKTETSVPPVDRGMLMFYNMGLLDKPETQNSIFDPFIARQYTASIKDYPLPLDAALPAFGWAVQFRNNEMIDLLNDLSKADFENNIAFAKIDSAHFKSDSSFFYHGYYFIKNDIIRTEEITPVVCKQAAEMISSEMNSNKMSVSLFSYQPQTKQQYERKFCENIFSAFR